MLYLHRFEYIEQNGNTASQNESEGLCEGALRLQRGLSP